MKWIFFLLLFACSSTQKTLVESRSLLENKKCDEALEKYDKLEKKEKLIATLGKSSAYACKEDFSKAESTLEEARKLFFLLDEKNPTENIIASTFVNDAAAPYQGELYEQIYLRIMRSLYFIDQKKYREASNDMRANYELLKLLSQKYKVNKDVIVAKVIAALTQEILYFKTGEINELNPARVSWELALKDACDGSLDETAEAIAGILLDYKKHFQLDSKIYCHKDAKPAEFWDKKNQGAEISIVSEKFIPAKTENEIIVPMPSLFLFLGSQGRFSPILGEPPLVVKVPKIDLLGSAPSKKDYVFFGDLGVLARDELRRTAPARGLRTGARVALKYIAMKTSSGLIYSEGARRNDIGLELLGAIGHVGSSLFVNATEYADLRSWDTVPRFFYFSRVRAGKDAEMTYRHLGSQL